MLQKLPTGFNWTENPGHSRGRFDSLASLTLFMLLILLYGSMLTSKAIGLRRRDIQNNFGYPAIGCLPDGIMTDSIRVFFLKALIVSDRSVFSTRILHRG